MSFWSGAIESRGDLFQNDNGAILRSQFKNSALCCFLTAFDSPHIIYRKNKRGTLDVYLFYFWWTRGEFALDFCKARSKIFLVNALQKSSVTVQKQRTVLFFHCVRFPSFYVTKKITREHSKEHSLIIFWWTRGESNPCPKTS